jgi:hypothetical protein
VCIETGIEPSSTQPISRDHAFIYHFTAPPETGNRNGALLRKCRELKCGVGGLYLQIFSFLEKQET